jgi:hypothetical protein
VFLAVLLKQCPAVCCSLQAYLALPQGGAFIALDTIIDDERRANCWGLGMSLNMLLEFETHNAFDYTFKVREGGGAQRLHTRLKLLWQ